MESSLDGTDKKKKSGLFGGALLIAAAVSLAALNLCDGYVMGWIRSVQAGAVLLDIVLFYALAHGFAALSLLAAAALVLAPGARRAWFTVSAVLAAASALFSAIYAAGWWVILSRSMVWQDYCCIVLQTLACILTVLAVIKFRNCGQGSGQRLLLAGAGIAVSTLAFLLPPVVESVFSVLTRTLSLGAPAVLLALCDAVVGQCNSPESAR